LLLNKEDVPYLKSREFNKTDNVDGGPSVVMGFLAIKEFVSVISGVL